MRYYDVSIPDMALVYVCRHAHSVVFVLFFVVIISAQPFFPSVSLAYRVPASFVLRWYNRRSTRIVNEIIEQPLQRDGSCGTHIPLNIAPRTDVSTLVTLSFIFPHPLHTVSDLGCADIGLGSIIASLACLLDEVAKALPASISVRPHFEDVTSLPQPQKLLDVVTCLVRYECYHKWSVVLGHCD